MSTDPGDQRESGRRLTPADLHNVRFPRATMMRPGYNDTQVDALLGRVAEEMSRLIEEKAALRDQVRGLQEQAGGVVPPEPPSEQALRILSTAQQTADNYVAEAEEFSRQVTSEARSLYEEQVRLARENAGAILQAAQEAAAKITDGGGVRNGGVRSGGVRVGSGERSVEELQEQVAYLKAFGQACRVQLRSYLEALLSDIESEWGRADPALLAGPPLLTSAQRSDREDPAAASTTFVSNTASETPADEKSEDNERATAGPGPRT
jgi:DivIVA domain-containing protein